MLAVEHEQKPKQPRRRLPRRRLAAIAVVVIGLLVAVVIVTGEDLGLYGTAADDAPVTGGNEWVEKAMSGSLEVETSVIDNFQFTINREDEDPDEFNVIDLSEFTRDGGEVTLTLTLTEEEYDDLQEWAEDPTLAELHRFYSEGDDPGNEPIIKWQVTSVTLEKKDTIEGDDDEGLLVIELLLTYEEMTIELPQ